MHGSAGPPPRAAKLDLGGRPPRQIAEVLAALAAALARPAVRLLLAHAAAILAAPAVRMVREDRYDCHDGGRGLYRTRDAASRPPCARTGRQLVPSAAVEDPAPGLRRRAAPLLEEEGHACDLALVTQRSRPVRIHRPGTRSGLAAGDDPVQPGVHAFQHLDGSVEVEDRERPKQRLGRDPTNSRGSLQQYRDPLVRGHSGAAALAVTALFRRARRRGPGRLVLSG